MAGKFRFSLFGVFLLAQFVQYANNQLTQPPSAKLETSENETEPTPRQQLYIYAMIGYGPLVKMTMLNGSVVIKNLLEETAALTNASTELKSKLTELNDFERKSYKLLRWKYSDEEMVQIAFELTTQLAEVVLQYHETRSRSQSNRDQLLIKTLLQKHDFEPVAQGFAEEFACFSPKFILEVEKYLTPLSPEQRMQELKMIDWFRQFQNRTNVRTFVKFFDLYPVQAALNVQKYKMWRDAMGSQCRKFNGAVVGKDYLQ